MKKKIISLILSAAMVATATVVPVSAADVKDFADVAADSWYYDSVDFVAERDYMNGTSATTFSPNDSMTRAMFVTVMARVAGAQTDNNAVTEFTDVPSGQWYTGAVQWGVEKGLVQGHGDGTFGTNDPITRQDTAVLAQRFLKWYSEATGLTPETGAKVDSFTDASSISDYAKDAVEYCRQIGLLTGYEDGSFQPLKTITRAEAATILKRMTFLAEGVLTVTYTDENGKSVMMEVKEGDTFTVDPNGGKITYDGKTYDAEFTITVGTASLTLPAPTRSGYTFKGWKVTEAADGTPAFTAQWASAGGGGGGGGSSVVAEETYTYQVSVGTTIPGLKLDAFESALHEVEFNAEGNAIDTSDVTLINLAEELVRNDGGGKYAQMQTMINALNSTPFFKNDVAQEVTVKTIKLTDVIDITNIANEDKYDTEFINAVIEILDSGVTSNTEFRSECSTKNLDYGNACEVVNKIIIKLEEMEPSDIIEKVDNVLGENGKTQKLLDAIGTSIGGIVTDYTNDLKIISGSKTAEPGQEVSSTFGITLNLVDAVKAQYDNGVGVEKAIKKALEAANVDQETIDKIFDETTDAGQAVSAFISACNPGNFFNNYKLKTDREYAEAICTVLEKADGVRKALCTGDDPLLEESQIASFIKKSVEKAKEYISDSSLTQDLDQIASKSDSLAKLFCKTDPTLLDLLDALEWNKKQSTNKPMTFNLSSEHIDTIIDKICSQIGFDRNDVDDTLIDDIKNKLVGEYTFNININVTGNN